MMSVIIRYSLLLLLVLLLLLFMTTMMLTKMVWHEVCHLCVIIKTTTMLQ